MYILLQSGLLLSEAALNVKCGALSVRTRHSRDALLQVEAALPLVTALALVLCHRLTRYHAMALGGHPVITRSAGQGVQECGPEAGWRTTGPSIEDTSSTAGGWRLLGHITPS